MATSAVQVVVRLKPPCEVSKVEINPNEMRGICLKCLNENSVSLQREGGGEGLKLYNERVSSLVKSFVDGTNVTILAYGQTSSGKTFTMGTSYQKELGDEGLGIIPRAAANIISLVESKRKVTPGVNFQIRCHFVEIYQEQFRDLLNPETDPKTITIREDKFGQLMLTGVHTKVVENVEDIMRCLEEGGVERTTGDNNVHVKSSRSHAIFTITLLQRVDTASGGTNLSWDPDWKTKISKLNLVDLAGSERLKRTGAEGIRLKESVKINGGLLALSNVIGALGSFGEGLQGGSPQQKETVFVPYRDSKLTRFLQDSLGGNAKTLMVACVSSMENDFEETLNTLKYAERARKIQNKPIVQDFSESAILVLSLNQKINELERKLSIYENDAIEKAADNNLVADMKGSEDMLKHRYGQYTIAMSNQVVTDKSKHTEPSQSLDRDAIATKDTSNAESQTQPFTNRFQALQKLLTFTNDSFFKPDIYPEDPNLTHDVIVGSVLSHAMVKSMDESWVASVAVAAEGYDSVANHMQHKSAIMDEVPDMQLVVKAREGDFVLSVDGATRKDENILASAIEETKK
ncbi:P-loop containing nucleoside triphosphate hydrolase protein [Chytridium lagenaria]|nr:P-loop containing nucleoside triphosphate hydrolase protein [Chytridium lagenaria]